MYVELYSRRRTNSLRCFRDEMGGHSCGNIITLMNYNISESWV